MSATVLVSCYHVFGGSPGDAALMRQEVRLGEASGALRLGGRRATFYDFPAPDYRYAAAWSPPLTRPPGTRLLL